MAVEGGANKGCGLQVLDIFDLHYPVNVRDVRDVPNLPSALIERQRERCMYIYMCNHVYIYIPTFNMYTENLLWKNDYACNIA